MGNDGFNQWEIDIYIYIYLCIYIYMPQSVMAINNQILSGNLTDCDRT